MSGIFEDWHFRATAIEWVLEQLFLAECLRSDDPLARAQELKRAATEYGDLLGKVARPHGEDQFVNAINIGSNLDTLMDQLLTAVAEKVK